MNLVTTPERVCTQLAVTLPADGTTDRASLDQAVEDASALVCGELDRDSIDDLRPSAQAAIQAVATRIAARIFRNPQELASLSYNDQSVSLQDPRILTGDEKAALRKYIAKVRGPIQQLTPSLEDSTWTW